MRQSRFVGVAAVLFGLMYAYVLLRHEFGDMLASGRSVAESTPGTPTHEVTSHMSEAAREMVGREAPPFTRLGTDEKQHSLADAIANGPVILTFNKVGCPCSAAAQPHFNRLAAAYPSATFLGVIDAESGPAGLWLGKLRPNYIHLFDPSLGMMRDYRIENSVYVVLIDPKGRIAEHWPGISRDMLRRLSSSVARLSGAAEATLDFAEAPDDLYSGCPFDLP